MAATLNSGDAHALLAQYWSDEYLFDPVNAFFRQKVSPRESEPGAEPPLLSCDAFLRFVNCPDDATSVMVLCKAAAKDTYVEVISRDGQNFLRRRSLLRDEDDPARRTVVVWPVPREANAEEVSTFFSEYGTVETAAILPNSGPRVEIPASAPIHDNDEANKKSHGGNSGPKTLATAAVLYVAYTVRFATVKEAEACVSAKVTYGTASTPLAQHFIPPRVHLKLFQNYLQQQRERIRQHEEAQLQANTARAQKSLAEAQEKPTVKRFLRPGTTLKIDDLPPGVTWQAIKAKLGGFALTSSEVRHGLTLVKIEEPVGRSGPKRRAFVVCRDAATASALRTCYSLAQGDYVAELRGVCPNLLPLTPEEEEYAQQHFPEWCERRVEAKQVNNRKRSRQ